jgi:hypothetical protein
MSDRRETGSVPDSVFGTDPIVKPDRGVRHRILRSALLISCALFLSVLVTPVSAGAEDVFAGEDTVSRVRHLMQEAGYARPDIQLVTGVFTHAESSDIPPRMLLPRVQEGIAKGVPPERMVTALEKDLTHLKEARGLITSVEGGRVLLEDRAQWQRAANMLAAGYTEDEVGELVRLCAGEPSEFRQVSILYVSLDKWGLPREEILSVAEALISSPISSGEYEGVVDLYRRARRQRIRPEVLTERIVSEARNAVTVEELRRRILY